MKELRPPPQAAIPVVRGQMARRDASTPRLPRWMRRVLGIPLGWKLAGANAIIVAAALATGVILHGGTPEDRPILAIMAIALAGSFAVNLALVAIALRPLRALESTASRVRSGDLHARVEFSPLTDKSVGRVGVALNDLLDALVADRARIRRLAAEVIRIGDDERARLARELHDSTAQTLSALIMQLSAMSGKIQDPELLEHLQKIRASAHEALEEVRLLAHTAHPRVLDDLGLPAALRYLSREMENRSGIPVEIAIEALASPPSPEVESALYRVAQEAISNALHHGAPSMVRVSLRHDAGAVTVEVADDGKGFDPAGASANADGLGIFAMRERLALVDGTFELVSEPGAGTRVTASVPTGTVPSPGGRKKDE